MSFPLYLDHPASTPPAEEVIDAMLPWLREHHANPHSDNRHGQRADAAVEQARSQVAQLLGVDSDEVVFTSGATESNNLALLGLLGQKTPSRLLALSGIEHKSLTEPARFLAEHGADVVRLEVDAAGRIDPANLNIALDRTADVKVVAVGYGNNEIGTLQQVAEIAKHAHANGAWIVVDASQVAGKISLDVASDDVDLVSISSHKLYGPGGIGALYVGRDVRGHLTPLMRGGGQEGGLRPGTIPVFLAVGFGVAAAIALRRVADDQLQLESLRRIFREHLSLLGIEHRFLGHPEERLPGILSIHFPGIDAAELLHTVGSELSLSTGSACTSGELRASHVLRAIGLSEAESGEVVRVGFGRQNTPTDAIVAAQTLHRGIMRMAERSSVL